jgi:enoyl-CoA hydratase/carnithine racemase
VSDAPRDILEVAYEGEIAVMTMNNPRRLNAFNWAMRSAMYEPLLEIEANESCRAIVLQGAGGNLCAGGDISAAVAMALMRSALNTGNDTVDMAVTTEVNYQSVLQNSADFAEAAAAFLEKRKPVFTGR